MATLGTAILPALDAIRSIGGILGLRPFQVKVRVRTWSGSRVGVGTKADTDTVLVNQSTNGTTQPVRVRQISRKEAIASGGLYTDRDLRVGPITPPYPAAFQTAAGGFDDTTIDPTATAIPTEILWIMSSPSGTFGIPAGGVFCDKIGEEATALHYFVVLRATGRRA